MSPRLKQILSGVMVFVDIVLIIFFIASALDGTEVGLSTFLAFFLAIDAFLSIDYIRELGYKIKHNEALEKENQLKQIETQELREAEDIAEEEEDLRDILTRRNQSQTGVRRQ